MLEELTEYRKKILIGAITAVLIVSGIAASATWFEPSLGGSSGHSSTSDSTGAQLIVELTDPAIVPNGTTSLNLTYSQIVLTAAGSSGTSQSISLVAGTDSSVNLLSLQNTSQTIALGELSTSYQVLSASFLVSAVSMAINGTTYPVALATGGNTLPVDLADPSQLNGTSNVLLLDLSPTIINSSVGYQFVPASLAVFKPESEITSSEGHLGSTQELSELDRGNLHHNKGSISADLLSMSVSGDITTMNIQVTNTGKSPEKLELFTIHGAFDSVCSMPWEFKGWGGGGGCGKGTNEVVFLPGEPHVVGTSTTTTSCAPRHISLVNSTDSENNLANPIVMNPGQCLTFSFSGTILTGNHILIPCIAYGREFVVHVFADRADSKMDCYFQQSSYPNCHPDQDDDGSD